MKRHVEELYWDRLLGNASDFTHNTSIVYSETFSNKINYHLKCDSLHSSQLLEEKARCQERRDNFAKMKNPAFSTAWGLSSLGDMINDADAESEEDVTSKA